MKLAIMGSALRVQHFKNTKPAILFTEVFDSANINDFDVFIDLDFDTAKRSLVNYMQAQCWVLLSATECTIEERMAAEGLTYSGQKIMGINAINGFVERNVLELCNPFALDLNTLDISQLGYQSMEVVASRVGLATPRVVFMIINEAYYTVQEKTANKTDIDTAMKLGTAYPHGPFEWLKIAGIAAVYNTLEAMWQDTHDERYKVCPLLKTEYLRSLIS